MGTQDSNTFPIRAYSYVRMSTRKQLRGDSLRRQLERSKAFADEHSLLLDDSLQDLGVSAWKGRNFKTGALGRFLAMVESGEIPKGSYLLIESLDRLSREAVPDALTLFMAIINAGIVIATLGEDRQIYSRDRLNGDWTKLIIGLAVMSRGHEESQTKSERVSAANRRKRENAREGKGQITGLTPAWIDAKRIDANRYEFTLNHHAATVQAIYEMAARGLGATVIARKLNADGVPAFKSKDGWYQSIIKALLTRHDVIGIFQPHRMQDGKRVPDGDPIDDYFPPAIDKDLFLRVQAMRSNPSRPGRKGNTFTNLFTGLCHCAHCGGPMTMKLSRVKGNENGRYLVCANYVRGHRCADGNRHFRYEPLEGAILDHVKELNLAETLHVLRLNDGHRELDETIAGLTLELEELRRKERRLAQVIEDDSEPPAAIMNLLKTRQAERQAIEAELRHQQVERQRRSIRQDNPTETCDRIGKLRGAWEQADDITRYDLRSEAHAAIREIIAEISFDSGDCSAMLIVENGIVVHRFTDGRAFRRHQMWRAIPVTMRSAI
ncbi:DNA invertase Pin-like site-specific DNA recombinase [Agrobacterium tumefaciens]|uniref:recombinase family protein n=1 Tax=Agrobacterium tumefaciens TaxID=358 RepID=UPI001AE173E5|nr:recombinase family protein [Agrobacterium tumefaciens]MBP2508522.1 DNA invertase Pin-like site-specific DNA recombinase [Agrobacterium tumefaciens]MBP2517674.1 DNA invertase Pin-like site-specific DNA recombinase [Agrobacterium tumefaciens]MBP2576308.1 DNA invertase Pin-like site-specific DNA recombinase [Agrobacterium tumefaciens]MBP2594664.1 DNA invertase Pin-like site-specific DNA recombinase [Agrobacterium tumefaciens]